MVIKRGRPKKPASERREHTLQVKVTTKERRAMSMEAKRKGQTLSNWLRVTALEAVKAGKRPGTPKKDARPGNQATVTVLSGETA